MATHVDALATPLRSARGGLLAADTSRTIITAPPAGNRIRVYRICYVSETSSANVVTVAAGATTLLTLAASVTAHVVIDTGWLDGGLVMPAATALIATPAAAGPAGEFFVTYSLE